MHKIDPNAKCAGPNYANFDRDKYDSFLLYCYDNNCLPELITWHELGDASMTSFFSNYDSVKAMAEKYYTDEYAKKSGRSYQPELLVNEYARHYDIGAPGGLVKWLAIFEDKDIDGCMAYWAMANSLNEMAADQNSPSSTWWVYHWYAQMTGEQCALTSPDFEDTRFYGLTSYDEAINMAYTIFGGARAYDKVGWSTFAASGRKDVGNINNNGDGVRFTVNVPEDGTYDVGLFYSLQAPHVDAQTLEPDANGQNRAIGQMLPYGMQVDDG